MGADPRSQTWEHGKAEYPGGVILGFNICDVDSQLYVLSRVIKKLTLIITPSLIWQPIILIY